MRTITEESEGAAHSRNNSNVPLFGVHPSSSGAGAETAPARAPSPFAVSSSAKDVATTIAAAGVAAGTQQVQQPPASRTSSSSSPLPPLVVGMHNPLFVKGAAHAQATTNPLFVKGAAQAQAQGIAKSYYTLQPLTTSAAAQQGMSFSQGAVPTGQPGLVKAASDTLDSGDVAISISDHRPASAAVSNTGTPSTVTAAHGLDAAGSAGQPLDMATTAGRWSTFCSSVPVNSCIPCWSVG